jgi:hypothetical protein
MQLLLQERALLLKARVSYIVVMVAKALQPRTTTRIADTNIAACHKFRILVSLCMYVYNR